MKFTVLLAFCVLLCLVQSISATSQLPMGAMLLGAGVVKAKLLKHGLLKAGGLALLRSGVKQHLVPSISLAPSVSIAPTIPVVPAIVYHRR